MKPYYDDGTCVIYHGRCEDVLPLLEPVDAGFADPPYNVGLAYLSHDDAMPADAYREWCREWFGALRSVVTGAVAITPGMVSVPMWLADIERTHFILAWTKANNNSRNYIGPTSGYQCWEPVLVYGKAKATVLRDWFDCPVSLQRAVGDHPCPKPLRLMRYIVESIVPVDGAIVDPFMGSGTTLRAAKDCGRKAVGIEIEEQYCEIAAKRLAQEVLAL